MEKIIFNSNIYSQYMKTIVPNLYLVERVFKTKTIQIEMKLCVEKTSEFFVIKINIFIIILNDNTKMT